MPKLKLAAYWASACGGCDVAILDINEKILTLAEHADIVLWPIATDFKYADVEAMPDQSIDVTLFSGAVRNSENEHLAKLLRQKTKTMVAFGSCAHMGGIPGLANLFNRDEIFNCVYAQSASLDQNGKERAVPHTQCAMPDTTLTLPEMHNTVRTLDQTIDVDYYVPGCPPSPHRVWEVVECIVKGELPPRGAVVGALDKTLCEECPREKRGDTIKEFKRVATATPDPKQCLVEQGFVCMGLATRAGCGHRCQRSGVGCRGCYGPPPGVWDQGLKALSAIASVCTAPDEHSAETLMQSLPDPLRTLNRFGIPASALRRRSL